MQLPWDGGRWPRPERRWRGGLLEGRVLRCLNQNLQDLGIFRIAGDRSGADGGNCRGNCRGKGSGGRGRGSGVKGQGSGDSGRKTVRRWRGGYWGGRCGGTPPAQGRAEGPTAQMDTHPWRRVPIVGMSQARKFSGLPIGRKVAILLPEVNIICGAERPSSDRRELCRSTRSVSNIV